ncbi:MAG: hypothetical protein AAF265_15815 [Pseudomonadota bacterium]
MTNSPRFNVVSTGNIITGFDAETVQAALLTRLRLKPEHAAQFFSRPRVLKKDLTKAEADKFCKGLAALGIEVKAAPIDPPVPKPTPQRLTDTVGFEPDQDIPPLHATEASLSLVEDDTPSRTSGDMIECPNCGHFQEKSEQCESCGIFFHKWDSTATHTTGRHPTQTATGLQAPASVTASKPAAASRQQKQERDFNVVALVAAAFAAIAGAWVWQFIAVTFGYEIGFVAWGIGGAVGFAAAMFGSRGGAAGAICGLLVVGSMALGRFWTYDSVIHQITHDPESYEYFKAEAGPYSRLDGSEADLRQFMVEFSYTDATVPSRVTQEDIEYFREFFEPQLLAAGSTSSYSEFLDVQPDTSSSSTVWSLIISNLGIIDAIFLFLGVGTAFRLAAQTD